MTVFSSDISGKIVSLGRKANVAGPAVLDQLERYWAGLLPDGGLPARSQIDPRAIRGVLSHVFILERIAPGVARFRIAGTELNRITGTDLRGAPLTTLFAARSRADVAAAVETCLGTPAITEATVKPHSGDAADCGTMLMLPMTCDAGRASRILGALVLPKGTKPCPLDIGWHLARPVFDGSHAADTVPPPADTATSRPGLRLVWSAD